MGQVNGDWSPALRRDHEQFSTNVVTDLEHLYRNLSSRSDLPSQTNHFLKQVRLSAYLPSPALASVFWQQVLSQAGDSFRAYFRKHCLRECQIEGVDEPVLLPLFFSGRGGKTRAGHPASQNLAELAVKLAKEVAAKKGVTKSEIEFLLALEKRYSLATECPSDIHGFLGSSQELRRAPLDPMNFSPDLIAGNGRPWKSMQEQRWCLGFSWCIASQCT